MKYQYPSDRIPFLVRACFPVIKVLTALSVLHGAPVWSADACDDGMPAQRWVAAIEAQDWDAMGALLSLNARYLDHTMAYFERPAVDLRGPQAITDFWRESSEGSGTSQIRYTIRDCFETSGIVALNLRVDVTVSGEAWGINKEQISLGGSQTTILQIRDGQIVQATDYVDYAGVDRQATDLREHYGSLASPPP